MRAGYVRTSTREQNTARQDELMRQLGVEKIYTDRMSGKSKDRPELQNPEKLTIGRIFLYDRKGY